MFSAHQPSKSCLLLIVEDDFLLRESLSLILAGEGYMVAVAENGQEAIKRLHATEKPSLILLDLALPVMDAHRFREEQQRDPALASIPVVLLSAADDVENQAAALGAAGYLQKPVETGQLLDTIKRHCQRARAASSPATTAVPHKA